MQADDQQQSGRDGSSQNKLRKRDISIHALYPSERPRWTASPHPAEGCRLPPLIWGHHTHEQLHCRLLIWVGKWLFGLSLLVFTSSKYWSWEERESHQFGHLNFGTFTVISAKTRVIPCVVLLHRGSIKRQSMDKSPFPLWVRPI